MSSSGINRITTVQRLLDMAEPLENTASRLRELGWDSNGDSVELTRRHLVIALRRYIDENLSEAEIEHWANLIEGREDVHFESGFKDYLHEVLNELANPTLTQKFDRARANELLNELMSLSESGSPIGLREA